MTAHPIPLATQLAGLRAAAEAHVDRCWLATALEAMIMAALARLFGRLEQLVRLWQAGLLPALSAPRAIRHSHGHPADTAAAPIPVQTAARTPSSPTTPTRPGTRPAARDAGYPATHVADLYAAPVADAAAACACGEDPCAGILFRHAHKPSPGIAPSRASEAAALPRQARDPPPPHPPNFQNTLPAGPHTHI